MTNGVLIIAEAGVNHNGSIERAIALVDSALDAGVDVIKFQSFVAEELATVNAEKAKYQKANGNESESQYAMLKALELSFESQRTLIKYCREKKIEFLSTSFDMKSFDFLSKEGQLKRIKIPSGEITNAPFLLAIAKLKKPTILSTGTARLADIENALAALAFGFVGSNENPSMRSFQKAYSSAEGQELLKKHVTILHCSTEYPAPLDGINLRAMKQLGRTFGLEYGYSDHSEGIMVSVAAVALGAKVIEKHFTLDKSLPGPDHKASLDSIELKNLVQAIRDVECALGSSTKFPSQREIDNAAVGRKSLVASQAIKRGEIFTEHNLTIKRPGRGVNPFEYWDYLNTTCDQDYSKDDLIGSR